MSFTKGGITLSSWQLTLTRLIFTIRLFSIPLPWTAQKSSGLFQAGKAVGKISDRLCLENSLSIIENPKRGKDHYGKWLGDKKPLTHSEKLRQIIDEILVKKPASFTVFLEEMKLAGYEVKQGSQLSFKGENHNKFIRLRSLGNDYSEEAIKAIISGEKALSNKNDHQKPLPRINLLVDIQAKLQAGKGSGYEQWAKIFNLKQMVQTINFLTEN